MFRKLIAEGRDLVAAGKRKKKELDERPEVSSGDGLSFPRRGLEKTQTLVYPGANTGQSGTRP